MQVAVTGAGGLLGRRLIRSLLEQGHLPGRDGAPRAIGRIVASDIGGLDNFTDARVATVAGDISDPAVLARAIPAGLDAVFHLAAIVSGQAEAEFELGMRINFDAARALLEQVRHHSPGARLVTTSSVAVFGGAAMPPVVPDEHLWEPQSSYGTQKAMFDLLLADYGRRGFVDARALRMPTVVVRPGKPNRAASSFASGIIREPLAGLEAICPVGEETVMWLISPHHAIRNIVHGFGVDADRLGDRRVINLPGLSVSVGDMLASLGRVAGADVAARVRMEPDESIQRLVRTWPGALEARFARRLGFTADADFDDVIRDHMREGL